MKLNRVEFALMNNPARAALQRWIETPALIDPPQALNSQRVLEIGCGCGVGMEILLSHAASHVTGFDLDPKMIMLAQQRLAQYNDRALIYVGDATAISAPDASFDAVVDYAIIHHIPNWPLALHEIARVLKPSGTFFFEDFLRGFTTLPPVRAVLDHPHETQFTASEFRAGLAAAGLNIITWRQFGAWIFLGRAKKQEACVAVHPQQR